MTLVKKVFVYLTIVVIANQLLAWVLNVLSIKIIGGLVWSWWGVILMVYVWLTRKSGSKILDKSDLLALITTGFTILAFVPSLWQFNKSFRLPIITDGVDAAVHFSLFSKMVDNGKVNYGQGYFDNFKPWSTWTEYPPGFYENAAMSFIAITEFGTDLRRDFVIKTNFFSLFMILTYSLFVFWVSQVLMEYSGKSNWWLKLAVAITLFEGGYYWLFNYGFMAQILALTLIVFMIWILKLCRKRTAGLWLVLLVLNFAVANSWYFLSGFVLVWLAVETVAGKLYKKWWFFASSLLMVYPTIYPVYKSLSTFNPYKELAAGGGVVPVASTILILLLLINTTKSVKHDRVWNISMIISGSYLVLIGIYQLLVRGSTSYYFDKSTYLLLFFLEIGLFEIISKLDLDYSKRWLLSGMAVFLVVISFKSSTNGNFSILNERKYFLNQETYNEMMVLNETGLKNDYTVVPFGTFKNLIWFYAYEGYLPSFYQEYYPRVEIESYTWIFENVKNIKTEKPIMIFDAYTVKNNLIDSQKEYLIKNKIPVYPQNVSIE